MVKRISRRLSIRCYQRSAQQWTRRLSAHQNGVDWFSAHQNDVDWFSAHQNGAGWFSAHQNDVGWSYSLEAAACLSFLLIEDTAEEVRMIQLIPMVLQLLHKVVGRLALATS